MQQVQVPILLPKRGSLFLGLPPELKLLIIQLLSREDLQTISLISDSCRQLVLPLLFNKLTYSDSLGDQIEKINRAREDVKAAIRKLVLNEWSGKSWDHSILFQFLRSVPNLQSFRWIQCFVHRHTLPCLVASLQHCPIEHFTYCFSNATHRPITVQAPSQLKSLAVRFHHGDLYKLIQPSFSTLVELEIFPRCSDNPPCSGIFDIRPLRPVGRTLRKFVYKMNCFDSDVLDAIPGVFPHLITLELVVWQGLLWKESYNKALSRNTKLQYLAVSAIRFLNCNAHDRHAPEPCPLCTDQRAEATHALAMACTGLRRCVWAMSHTQYAFNIKARCVDGDNPFAMDVSATFKSFSLGRCYTLGYGVL